jgi:hypothetical protein
MADLFSRAQEIKLTTLADELLQQQIAQSAFDAAKAEMLDATLQSFKTEFADELALIAGAGIKVTAALNSEKWLHEGAHICFERKGRKLRMGYTLDCTQGGAGWRYEHSKYTGKGYYYTMVYGKWPKDRFICWLADFFQPDQTQTA